MHFVCKHRYKVLQYARWNKARQIKSTHIITVDNKDVEVSEENFQTLKVDILTSALTVTGRPK